MLLHESTSGGFLTLKVTTTNTSRQTPVLSGEGHTEPRRTLQEVLTIGLTVEREVRQVEFHLIPREKGVGTVLSIHFHALQSAPRLPTKTMSVWTQL